MSTSPKLTIDLVPKTAWGSNARSIMIKSEWQIISRKIAKRAAGRCEICLDDAERIEAHEIWNYIGNLQRLVGLVGLCPDCHRVKHFGLAQTRGEGVVALDHLCAVNGWTRAEGIAHIDISFQKWEERSYQEWSLDVSAVDELADLAYGATVEPDSDRI